MKHVSGDEIDMPMIRWIGVVQNTKASRVKWHKHNMYELLFLLHGKVEYEFKGNRSVLLYGGQMLVIPPNLVHRGRDNIRSPSKIFSIALNKPLDVKSAKLTPFTHSNIKHIVKSIGAKSLSSFTLTDEMKNIARRLFDIIVNHQELTLSDITKAKIRALISLLMIEIVDNVSVSIDNSKIFNNQKEKEIAAATEFIEREYRNVQIVDKMIKYLGYGRARTFELFKEYTGTTPNDYLLRHRIKKACELLSNAKQQITSIAYSTGFSSSQHFSQVFRKYTGKSPRQYRADKVLNS